MLSTSGAASAMLSSEAEGAIDIGGEGEAMVARAAAEARVEQERV